VQDQNYMYKNKTSLQKTPLRNHMSIFFFNYLNVF